MEKIKLASNEYILFKNCEQNIKYIMTVAIPHKADQYSAPSGEKPNNFIPRASQTISPCLSPSWGKLPYKLMALNKR